MLDHRPALAIPDRAATGDNVALAVHQVPGIALVIQGRAQRALLVSRLAEILGAPPPETPGAVGDPVEAVWSGPDRWLLVSPDRQGAPLPPAAAFAGTEAIRLDQSDGWLLCSLSGPAAIATLRKGVLIDLAPQVFGPGAAALTALDGMACCLWRPAQPADGRFRLLLRCSFTSAFLRWFEVSAAEYGFGIRAG